MLKLEIRTSHLFNDQALRCLQIEVETLPQAVKRLEDFAKDNFPYCAEKVSDYRWDTAEPGCDSHTMLVDENGLPLEFTKFGDKPMTSAIEALRSQVQVYQCVVPIGGESFYKELRALLERANQIGAAAATEHQEENLRRSAGNLLAHYMNCLGNALFLVVGNKLANSYGANGELDKAQWEAIEAQAAVVCRAAQTRFHDLNGVEVKDCWPFNCS